MPNRKKPADTAAETVPSRANGNRRVIAPVVASSFALGFIVVCLVIYLLHISATIMIPFVIALCLWYLINAMARGLSRLQLGTLKLPRFFCFLFAIAVLVAAMWFILSLINHNIRLVMEAAPGYQHNLKIALAEILTYFNLEQEVMLAELQQYLNITGIVATLAATFTGIAGKTLVVMFYTGFLLYEQRFFESKINNMIENENTEKSVRAILKRIDINIQRYIWVKVLISALTGICTYLVLMFYNVDFNQFWGLMAFVLNFIPYIGSLLAITLPSIIALIQFNDLTTFLIIGSLLGVIQITLGSIIDPRMLGDSLNISPIMIIFSLAAWGMIWGIPGMFLSIPILAMVVITLGQFPKTRPIAILLSKTGHIEDEGSRKA